MVVCWSHAVYNFYGLRVGDGACGTAIACWPVLTTSIAPTYHQNWRGQLNHQNERVSQGQLQLTSLYRLCCLSSLLCEDDRVTYSCGC